jgi:hypothetical protein
MKRQTGAHDASDAAALRCGAAVAFYRHVTDRGYAGDDAGTPEMRSVRLWLNTNASRLLLDVFAPCADALTAQPQRTRSSAAAAPRRRASPARGLRPRNGAQRSAFARQRSQPRGPLQPPQQRSRQPRPEAQTTSLHLPRHQAVARRFAAFLLALRLHPSPLLLRPLLPRRHNALRPLRRTPPRGRTRTPRLWLSPAAGSAGRLLRQEPLSLRRHRPPARHRASWL